VSVTYGIYVPVKLPTSLQRRMSIVCYCLRTYFRNESIDVQDSRGGRGGSVPEEF
jgi:hypothetical protein